MFKSYLITAWRNLNRHKMYAAINVLGLALGISACLVIYLIASFELSVDNFHPGNERIYRIVSDSYSSSHGENHSASIPDAAPFAIREEITGLESVAVFCNYEASATIQDNGRFVKKFEGPKRGEKRSDIVIAEPQYFDIFQYEWLAGNAAALKEPYTVVLTESKAKLYFGEHAPADMLNKTISYNDSLHVTVAGILKDPRKNTDFFFGDFISFSTIGNSFLKNDFNFNSWEGVHSSSQVFVKLAKTVQATDVNTQLTGFANSHLKQAEGSKTAYLLQPLSTIHFNADYADAYSRKVHLPTLYGLMTIALFILVIAVINFITLSTAQSIDRVKETAIRKICGSTRTGLIARFMSETFLLTLLAVLLSVSGIQLILSAFSSFIPDGVRFPVFGISTWVFLLILTLFTTLLAGIYPAKILSSAPAMILKSTSMQKGKKGYFIKGLIVFQFTISLVFIIGTLVVSKQVQFMLNKELGFAQDAMLTIQTNEGYPAAKKDLLAEKIRQLPEVGMVSLSEGTPVARLHWFNPLIYKGKEEKAASCILEWGDQYYVPLYNIKIIAGRNVLPSDSIKEFLVNEMCAKALGFARPEDAIGQLVETISPADMGMVARPIVGVMADFHSQSLHEAIKPVVFTTSKEFTRLMNIKLQTGGKEKGYFKTAVSKIEKCWKEIYPHDPFSYTFFEDTIAKFYEKEKQTVRLMNTAMLVSICISCLGLFGMASLTIRRRTKEIGIRKVLGAGVGQIVFLLSQDTIKLVLIAIIVASPIAWYAMNLWLNSFAFHIAFSWWILALAGAIALFIAFCTVSYQSIKTALDNPVNSIRTE
jgi:putative ABC transport system permease protein